MASGDTLLIFVPQANEPPSASFATLDERNNHPVLDFAVNEIAIFSAVMPRNYAGGGVNIYLHYSMSSATSGNIKLETDFERIGDQQQDIDSDGFTGSGQNTGDTAVPGTSGLVDIASTAHTNGAQMDSIAVGEGFRLKVKRITATSEASGDLELRFVEIKES